MRLRPTQAVNIATHADGTMGVDRYHYAVYAKRDLEFYWGTL